MGAIAFPCLVVATLSILPVVLLFTLMEATNAFRIAGGHRSLLSSSSFSRRPGRSGSSSLLPPQRLRPDGVRSRLPTKTTTTSCFPDSLLHSPTSRQVSSTTALFGIKGFRLWFESDFPTSIQTVKAQPPSSNRNKKRQPSRRTNQTAHQQRQQRQPYEFEHVLVDLNQLLHSTVRRAQNDSDTFKKLMSELDSLLGGLATPTKSLVLAMDGPPSASKVATQRRRRFRVIQKSMMKQRQLEEFGHYMTSPQRKRAEEHVYQARSVMSLTPGTQLMEQAEQAVLYWIWQRMDNPSHFLSTNKVKVYFSSTRVPGEGEVKLLDWVYSHARTELDDGDDGGDLTQHKRRNLEGRQNRRRPNRAARFIDNEEEPMMKIQAGDSIAIIGGDSDLILEGLMIPPASTTHDVFVLLPNQQRQFQVVSIWEITRSLELMLPQQFDPKDMMRARTDMALLLILNGNDYLPKLAGHTGFSAIIQAYLRLLHKWMKEMDNNDDDDDKPAPFLIDPDTLNFNLDFCISYFSELASSMSRPPTPPSFSAIRSPYSELINLVNNMGFFVYQPLVWEVEDDKGDILGEIVGGSHFVPAGDIAFLSSSTSNGTSIEEMAHGLINAKKKRMKVAMIDEDDEMEDEDDSFGEHSDEEFVDNDDEVDPASDDVISSEESGDLRIRLKMGDKKKYPEYYRTFEIWHEEDTATMKQIRDTQHKLAIMALKEILGSNYDLMETEGGTLTNACTGYYPYEWEIPYPVEGRVEAYLEGLVWTLQTYQDGICSDYAYNYGRRLSPDAREIVQYFKIAKAQNQTVGKESLYGNKTFSEPPPAGISCLAVLPSLVKELIPEPFSLLPNNTVEDLYARCMDPVDNHFDLKRFERLVKEEIEAECIVGSYFCRIDENGNEIEGVQGALATARAQGGDDNSNRASRYENGQSQRCRDIRMYDDAWVVLSRRAYPRYESFRPPRPMAESKLRNLPMNRMIQVSHTPATGKPRDRWAWRRTTKNSRHSQGSRLVMPSNFHSEMEKFLRKTNTTKLPSINEVAFKAPYSEAVRKDLLVSKRLELKKSRLIQLSKRLKSDRDASTKASIADTNVSLPLIDVLQEKCKAGNNGFVVGNDQNEDVTGIANVQGESAVNCLHALSDIGALSFDWNEVTPLPPHLKAADGEDWSMVNLTVTITPEAAQKMEFSPKSEADLNREYHGYRNLHHEKLTDMRNRLAAKAMNDLIPSWRTMRKQEMQQRLGKVDIPTCQDGLSALHVLKDLNCTDMISISDFRTISPTASSNSDGEELVEIEVTLLSSSSNHPAETRCFQATRSRNVKKQTIRHSLASQALDSLVPAWRDVDSREIRKLLRECEGLWPGDDVELDKAITLKKRKQRDDFASKTGTAILTNPDGYFAISLLNELEMAKLISVSEFNSTSLGAGGKEVVNLEVRLLPAKTSETESHRSNGSPMRNGAASSPQKTKGQFKRTRSVHNEKRKFTRRLLGSDALKSLVPRWDQLTSAEIQSEVKALRGVWPTERSEEDAIAVQKTKKRGVDHSNGCTCLATETALKTNTDGRFAISLLNELEMAKLISVSEFNSKSLSTDGKEVVFFEVRLLPSSNQTEGERNGRQMRNGASSSSSPQTKVQFERTRAVQDERIKVTRRLLGSDALKSLVPTWDQLSSAEIQSKVRALGGVWPTAADEVTVENEAQETVHVRQK